jgi:hypothetical protein
MTAVPRPRAWLTLLTFVLMLGAFAHRADAQAFRPRSRTGIAKATPKATAVDAPTTPRKAPTRTAATTPPTRKATAAKPAAKKKPPAKKKPRADDDEDVVVVDDDEDEDDE